MNGKQARKLRRDAYAAEAVLAKHDGRDQDYTTKYRVEKVGPRYVVRSVGHRSEYLASKRGYKPHRHSRYELWRMAVLMVVKRRFDELNRLHIELYGKHPELQEMEDRLWEPDCRCGGSCEHCQSESALIRDLCSYADAAETDCLAWSEA